MRTFEVNKLTRRSSGRAGPQLSQLADPLWTDPGLRCGTGEREMISTKKKKKKTAGGE